MIARNDKSKGPGLVSHPGNRFAIKVEDLPRHRESVGTGR